MCLEYKINLMFWLILMKESLRLIARQQRGIKKPLQGNILKAASKIIICEMYFKVLQWFEAHSPNCHLE